jgi:hypothetical protein
VVEALAQAGQWDHAEQAARTITKPYSQARALTTVAKALAETDPNRAAALATDAEQTARTITDPNMQAQALTAVAGVLAETDPNRAAALATDAEQTARTITDPNMQAQALTTVAKALAQTDPDRAATPLVDGAGRSELLHVRTCQLLADVLSGESWLEAMELLGKLDPLGVAAVFEALHAPNSGKR